MFEGRSMNLESRKSTTFFGVAIIMILIGAALFSIGAVSWFVNCYLETTVISIPSLKIMGGLVIMALGYIILELELIRKK